MFAGKVMVENEGTGVMGEVSSTVSEIPAYNDIFVIERTKIRGNIEFQFLNDRSLLFGVIFELRLGK